MRLHTECIRCGRHLLPDSLPEYPCECGCEDFEVWTTKPHNVTKFLKDKALKPGDRYATHR